jgi:hypothetical protein
MASNFRILVHRNDDSFHLKLMGDFDRATANELLNALKKYSNAAHRIFIHTNCLENIYPSGLDRFHQSLYELSGRSIRILFTGENASQIAPENSMCL